MKPVDPRLVHRQKRVREGNARSFYTFSRRRVRLLAHLRFSNPVSGSKCPLARKRLVSSTQQLELAMHKLAFRPRAIYRLNRGMRSEAVIGCWREFDALQRDWVQHANAQLK
jgi:hypothetical protein